MAYSHDDLLDIADLLSEQSAIKTDINTEAYYRSIANRLYYACFSMTTAIMYTRGYAGPMGESSHKHVLNNMHTYIAESKPIRRILTTLLEYRVDADYKFSSNGSPRWTRQNIDFISKQARTLQHLASLAEQQQ